ncbi:MAG: hypothetical protein FI713_00735 [SAR202 cluster bacterium]|nr:hypothetical protein [SAR202 cluster bacterium]
MNLVLLRMTLRLSRWAIVGWISFLVLYSFLIIWIYPLLAENEGMALYVQSMPEEVLNTIGLTPEIVDDLFAEGGFSFEGWLATEYLAWWPIMVGIYAFMFCSGIVAREAERGTMELLLSQPVSRSRIVSSKLLGFLVIIAMIIAGSLIGIILSLPLVDVGLDLWRVFLVLAQAGMLVGVIATYSTLVSSLVMDPRKAMTISGGLMAFSYILNLLAPALSGMDWILRFSLFSYFKPFEIMLHGNFSLQTVAVYLILIIVFFVTSLIVIERQKAVVQ